MKRIFLFLFISLCFILSSCTPDTGTTESDTTESGTTDTGTTDTGTTDTSSSSTYSANSDERGISNVTDDLINNTTFANIIYIDMATPSFSTDNSTFTDATSSSQTITDNISAKLKNNKLSLDCSAATATTKFIFTGTGSPTSTVGIVIEDDDTDDSSSYDICLDLNGVTIYSGNYPCIYVKSAIRTFVVLEDGKTNTFIDGRSYGTPYGDDYTNDSTNTEATYTSVTVVEDGSDAKGSLFSKGQLLFSGTGSLDITTSYKHSIYSKDYIHFYNGNITIANSGRNGIQSVNGFIMEDGSISITGTGTNTNNQSRGIIVEGSEDELGEGFILINGGTITSTTVGKAVSAKWDIDEDAETTETTDDPYPYLKITGGTISITTKGTPLDDSSSAVTFTDADGVSVTETTSLSPEGLEGKQDVFITGGKITLNTTDDGINASSTSGVVKISGGEIYVKSTGNDAIDSNGTLTISGGTIVALGTTTPECAFDCDQNTFAITGGVLVGLGTSNFTEPSSSACTQNTVVLSSSCATAGSTLAIVSNSTCAFAYTLPSTSFDVIVLSSPELATGTKYTIYKSATVTGTSFNGLYTTITDFTAGTSSGTTFTPSTTVTTVGTVNNQGAQEGSHPNNGGISGGF